MNLEDLENKEELIKEFFTWLFDDYRIIKKDVNLEKEIDLVLAPNYIDANIYYPKQISDFFNTKAMKRLGRISQLDLAIDEFPNLYHNRLEHSKGVYYRKLEEMLYNFQNAEWKHYIESNNLKLYLFAELLKMAGHDIGHPPLSHALEVKLFGRRGAHEEIGKRIMLEDEEIKSLLISISPDLLNTLKYIYENHVLNFTEHDESNCDVDRLDYLSRDNLYAGTPIHIPYFHYDTVNQKDKNGRIYTIDVYQYSDLNNIEHFLESRESGYKDIYFSKKTFVRERCIEYLLKLFIESDSKSGNKLRHLLDTFQETDLSKVDLSLFLEWDDIKFYSEVLDIAQHHENEDIRALATMIIPTMDRFLTMIYSHLNIYQKGQIYSDEDTIFLKNIKYILQNKHSSFYKNLCSQNFVQDNILIFPEDLDLTQYDELIQKGLIHSSHLKIKAYDPAKPIFVRDSNNEIYELSKHPNRKCDWDKKTTDRKYTYAYIPFLNYKGLLDEQIEELRSFCNRKHDYRDDSDSPKKSHINMQPLQIGHKIEDCFLEL